MASDASLVDNKKPSSSKKVAKVIHVAFKSFLAESALDDAKAAESSAIAALAQFKSSHGDSSSAQQHPVGVANQLQGTTVPLPTLPAVQL